MGQVGNTWLIVVNVFAASKKAGEYWSRAENLLKHRGIPYHCRYTGDSGNARRIAEDAAREGYRKFVAVGGDGTVHDVLNGILSFVEGSKGVSLDGYYLSVIPLGSGNDWIKSLGLPRNISKIVSLMADDSFVSQDVAKVSCLDFAERDAKTSYMVNVAGVGLDAEVCRVVNVNKKMGMRGKMLYVKALLQCLASRRTLRARILCDGGEVFSGAFLSIAVGLGRYSGGGMQQTSEAVMDDGLLDVVIIPDISLLTIAKRALRLFTGTFAQVPEVVFVRAGKVEVLPEGVASHVEVDGEVVGTAPVTFEVMDSRIHVPGTGC